MATEYENISNDLIWQVTRQSNAFLCKRKSGGGVLFSRDPFNLMNKHSYKYSGYANARAISIQPDSTNTVGLQTKNPKRASKPAKQNSSTSFSSSTPNRKLYRSIVNSTAGRGYRIDLRREAVARASAIKRSQGEKKDTPAPKLRGAKARRAKETASGSS